MSETALAKLSEAVQKAVAEIRRLRRDNERLGQKAAKLQERLEASPEAADGAAWLGERRDIRRRVERLAERLESILESD